MMFSVRAVEFLITIYCKGTGIIYIPGSRGASSALHRIKANGHAHMRFSCSIYGNDAGISEKAHHQ
jgi:hypothetical protein